MTRWRFAALVLAALAVTWVCTAWAEDVTIVQQPADSDMTTAPQPASPDVTVVQEPAVTEPGAKVTVIKDTDAGPTVMHEAVVGVTQPRTEVVVKEAPPAPRHEVVETSARPGADFVWVPGYWRWDTANNTYTWISGTWRRSIPGETWRPGHWQKTDTGYIWINGYWAPESGTSATVTVVKQAPPAMKVEVKPASPGADYVWIPGYWEYRNGEYTWTAGRWDHPPATGMVWLPGQWVDTGAGFAYVAGHWDYPVENRTVVVQRTTP